MGLAYRYIQISECLIQIGGVSLSSLTNKDFERKAQLLRILAHPVRLHILACMLENPDCSFKDLLVVTEKSQSTISQHIAMLKTAGIIECERQGTKIKCFIVEDTFRAILSSFLNGTVSTIKWKENRK